MVAFAEKGASQPFQDASIMPNLFPVFRNLRETRKNRPQSGQHRIGKNLAVISKRLRQMPWVKSHRLHQNKPVHQNKPAQRKKTVQQKKRKESEKSPQPS